MTGRGIVERAHTRLAAQPGDWQARHLAAVRRPQGFEAGIVYLVNGLAAYLDAYTGYPMEDTLSDNGVFGDAWFKALKATRALLNGETGRLDAGTLDAILCDLGRLAGFEEGDL